jgi:hypothetical protein
VSEPARAFLRVLSRSVGVVLSPNSWHFLTRFLATPRAIFPYFPQHREK